ncbi:thioredoxin family protein [Paracoccus suum]|uniref:Thioredoxin family protein n=1 Tax=Paracoccus suum TaxID=2259340 RepID=A0A344PLY6_9RHOB|nr:thioredoxin family protein [Paracoccus suum]AXC50391.1 thioredoxin family protein [Paracoccus suum]
MAATAPVCDFGAAAPDFTLPDVVTGARVTLADVVGPRGTLVMFICNHCPYVQAILDKIIRDARELEALGIGVVAISANDATAYPEDGPEAMAALARSRGFPFPYLHDADQTVARAYDAACTPDFFGYNKGLELQYRGRLDASGRQPVPADAPRELFEAMRQIADTGQGPRQQTASIGCSIKWRAA